MPFSLADGQLATSTTAVYAGSSLPSAGGAASGSCVNITLNNTSASVAQTVVVYYQRTSTGTNRMMARAVLAAYERLIISGLPLDVGDTILAVTTTASVVDYVVSVAQSNVPFEIFSLDANGAVKQVNSGVSGAQTLTGKLTAAELSVTAFTGDVYASTNTIDVTKGYHVIQVVNGTSATSTWTPSAAGTAGDILTIVTEADSSGTVTVTFASTFRSSGTQATTASKASSIVFQSDGTKWIELCRTTALT